MTEPTPDPEPTAATDEPSAPDGPEPADGAEGSRAAGTTREADDATDGPVECPYCDRRFAREDWLALHEGLEHEAALSADERAAYEAALAAEREQLRLFRYKALGALVALYFGFIMLYAVAL